MSVGADVTSDGRLFQRRHPATGNVDVVVVFIFCCFIFFHFFLLLLILYNRDYSDILTRNDLGAHNRK